MILINFFWHYQYIVIYLFIHGTCKNSRRCFYIDTGLLCILIHEMSIRNMCELDFVLDYSTGYMLCERMNFIVVMGNSTFASLSCTVASYIATYI